VGKPGQELEVSIGSLEFNLPGKSPPIVGVLNRRFTPAAGVRGGGTPAISRQTISSSATSSLKRFMNIPEHFRRLQQPITSDENCSPRQRHGSTVVSEEFVIPLHPVFPTILWQVKPRPPPKATGQTKIAAQSIDYCTSQLPASDKRLAEGHVFSVIDPPVSGGLPALGVIYPERHSFDLEALDRPT